MVEGKKSEGGTVPSAFVHVVSSFNNIMVSFVDTCGNLIAWASAGSSGFKGAKKSTPYAGHVTGTQAAMKAKKFGVKIVEVILKGPGSARDSAVRAIRDLGISIVVLKDCTPRAHNGCRARRIRRV